MNGPRSAAKPPREKLAPSPTATRSADLLLSGKKEEIKGKTRVSVDTFLAVLYEIREKMSTNSPAEVVSYTLGASGLRGLLEASDDPERVGNLSELVAIAQRYDHLPPLEGMERFLSDIALATDQDHGDGRKGVRLMTVHAAKGLEFDTVFIAGIEEDLFPQRRANEGPNKDREEEERRLFYVALTRAKRKLILSHASFRTIFGMQNVAVPSSYLSDIDENLIEVDTERFPQQQMLSPQKKQRFVFFD